jgi:hypothetical protein
VRAAVFRGGFTKQSRSAVAASVSQFDLRAAKTMSTGGLRHQRQRAVGLNVLQQQVAQADLVEGVCIRGS